MVRVSLNNNLGLTSRCKMHNGNADFLLTNPENNTHCRHANNHT
jgi:hypothetical protein